MLYGRDTLTEDEEADMKQAVLEWKKNFEMHRWSLMADERSQQHSLIQQQQAQMALHSSLLPLPDMPRPVPEGVQPPAWNNMNVAAMTQDASIINMIQANLLGTNSMQSNIMGTNGMQPNVMGPNNMMANIMGGNNMQPNMMAANNMQPNMMPPNMMQPYMPAGPENNVMDSQHMGPSSIDGPNSIPDNHASLPKDLDQPLVHESQLPDLDHEGSKSSSRRKVGSPKEKRKKDSESRHRKRSKSKSGADHAEELSSKHLKKSKASSSKLDKMVSEALASHRRKLETETRDVGVQVKTQSTIISLQKKNVSLSASTQTPDLENDDSYEAELLRGGPLLPPSANCARCKGKLEENACEDDINGGEPTKVVAKLVMNQNVKNRHYTSLSLRFADVNGGMDDILLGE